MKYMFLVMLVICFSCGNEKSIQLPEIKKSSISKANDGVDAYIFYDEEQEDSIRRKPSNLDISQIWNLNIDKNLTLRQAIPSIQALQNKKRGPDQAQNQFPKNYFVCTIGSSKNVGLLDFSDVIYHYGIDKNIVENQDIYDVTKYAETNYILSILFKENDSVAINSADFSKSEFVNQLKYMDSIQTQIMGIVYLKFNQNLTFQEYIDYKSILSEIKLKHATISNDEYIFD